VLINDLFGLVLERALITAEVLSVSEFRTDLHEKILSGGRSASTNFYAVPKRERTVEFKCQ
jgi:hypothetical protein